MTDVLIKRELLEQVASEFEHDNDRYMLGRELRKVLDAPRQSECEEPVAWMNPYGGVLQKRITGLERETFTIPLYTAPQPGKDVRAENARLRATAIEMRNWISCSDVNHRKGEFHDGDECPVLARIDTALSELTP